MKIAKQMDLRTDQLQPDDRVQGSGRVVDRVVRAGREWVVVWKHTDEGTIRGPGEVWLGVERLVDAPDETYVPGLFREDDQIKVMRGRVAGVILQDAVGTIQINPVELRKALDTLGL